MLGALSLIAAAALTLSIDIDAAGLSASRTDQLPQTIPELRRVVDERPRDVEARLRLARMLWRAGMRDAAEDEYRRALAQAPDHADALTGLAVLLNARGQREEAAALLDRAEQLAPASPDVLAYD